MADDDISGNPPAPPLVGPEKVAIYTGGVKYQGTVAAIADLAREFTGASAKIAVSKEGSLVGNRQGVNFVSGSNVALSATDNPAQNRIDLTISATGGGGGGSGGAVSSVAGRTGAVNLTSSDLLDSTASGRAMITASDAAAQTALLNTFTITNKGLVPSPGNTSNTTDFLRRDGQWAAPAGSGGGGGSITSGQITDSTPAGRSMITAADAAAQTALLNNFTASAKGLVPSPGTATGKVLSDAGTWVTGGGGGTGAPGPAGGNFFVDRAAAVAATAIPLSIEQIHTGCYSLSGNRRRGGAIYSRLASAPSAALQATTGTIHAVNDANVSGGSWWIIQASKGGVEFDQLGCVSSSYNDYTTGAAANAAAFLAYEELVLDGFYSDVKTLYVNPGWYVFPGTLILKRTPVAIVGQGTPTDWPKTVFAFPYHNDGIILHYGNTKGNTTLTQEFDPPGSPTNNGGGAGGSRFEGFTVYGSTLNPSGQNFDMTGTHDGIVLRARAYLRNIFVGNFARHGIYVVTSIGAGMDNPTGAGNGYPAGNANNVRIHDTAVQWCGGTGIRIAGADSNACSIMDSECNYCGHWGALDVSFLGPNGFYNYHTTDNCLGVGSTPTNGYVGIGGKSGALVTYNDGSGIKTYLAVLAGDFTALESMWGLYGTTVPGTNENVWQFYHNGEGGFSKPWISGQSRGYYTTGGALGISGINLKTAAIATYHESGQPPVQFYCGGGTYMGSQTASNMAKGCYGFIDDNYELRSNHHQVARYIKSNVWQENRYSALWANDQSTPATNYRKSSEFSMALYEAYEGDNFVTRYEASNAPAHTRLKAVAGFSSTGLGVDGSGQAPDPGLHIFPYFATAVPYTFGWQIRRQVVIHNHEITAAKLGAYDIAWYSEPYNGTSSTDTLAFVKGGWVGRAMLTGGDSGVAKTWAHFGQIEDLRELGPGTLSSLFSGAPNSLAAGASTGWLQWGGLTGVTRGNDLSLTFWRGSDVGGDPTFTTEARWFSDGVVGIRITNTGTASLNLGGEVGLALRVRK